MTASTAPGPDPAGFDDPGEVVATIRSRSRAIAAAERADHALWDHYATELRRVRKAAGMSQAALAAVVGVGPTTITNFETRSGHTRTLPVANLLAMLAATGHTLHGAHVVPIDALERLTRGVRELLEVVDDITDCPDAHRVIESVSVLRTLSDQLPDDHRRPI